MFTIVGTYFGDSDLHVTGVSDLSVVYVGTNGLLDDETSSARHLISTSIKDGGLLSFSLANNEMVLIDRVDFPDGNDVLTGPMQFEVATVQGQTFVASFGGDGTSLSGYFMDSAGRFTQTVSFGNDSSLGRLAALEIVDHPSGGQLIFTTDVTGSGLSTWRVDPTSGNLIYLQTLQTPSHSPMTTAPDLAQAMINGKAFLLMLSAADDALISFEIAENGSLTRTGELGAAGGLGIAAPQAIEIVEQNGTTYAIVAAAGSSSLSVVELSPDGSLSVTDHVIDDRYTRFAGVQTLEVVTVRGQVLVIAGGADDGLSLLMLLPGGRLVHIDSFADENDTNLTNVQSISAYMTNGDLNIFASGSGDIGITHLIAQTLRLDTPMIATDTGSTLTGSWRSDLLIGGDGDDTLDGGQGHDRILDGAGSDLMTGGRGADIFILTKDGVTDTITDFNPFEDKIDLSAFGRIYSTVGQDWQSTATGAQIRLDGELLEIVTDTRTPLDLAALPPNQLFNIAHFDLSYVEETETITGNDGDDQFVGGNNNDTLSGGGGNDLIKGRAGDDILNGDSGNDTLSGNSGNDALFGGTGDDKLSGGDGGDTLEGGTGSDTLDGNTGRDTLFGGDDSDVLRGGDDDDSLFGEEGADVLWGGTGNDVLFGGSGFDILKGEDGNDTMFGGGDDDSLFGGDGDDTLLGGEGNDKLNGGNGHDILLGERGDDTVIGLDGNDTLYGDGGNDYIDGGAGTDLIFGGYGDDTMQGGAGDDVLEGGAGADWFIGGGGFDTVSFATSSGRVLADLDVRFGDVQTGLATGDYYVGMRGLIGTAFNDNLRGALADNVLYGGDGDDWVFGRWGNDTLFGGNGDDMLLGGTGADYIDGGDGTDTLNLRESYVGVRVDLMDQSVNTGVGKGDVYVSIENISGSRRGIGDSLRGDNQPNVIDGREGNDYLFGRGGDDTLIGGEGDDVLYGGTGADVFVFKTGSDTIHDFNMSEGDTLAFDPSLWGGGDRSAEEVLANASRQGTTVTFSFSDESELTLLNMQTDLGLEDYVWVL